MSFVNEKKPRLVLARRLYNGVGDAAMLDQIIEIRDGKIVDIRPVGAGELQDRKILSADIVAPGFIDLQINGACDVQFNTDISEDAVEKIAAGARKGGAAYILPTFITAPAQTYQQALSVVESAIINKMPGVLGIHLEGPFLSSDRPGIHPQNSIRKIEPSDIDILTAPSPARILITLAPENQPESAISALTNSGVKVFAGHSNATAKDMRKAEGLGISGVTHLYNAMSQMTGREPGVVGSVMASDHLSAGIIVDGFHVDPSNVIIAVRAISDRLCLVTDAMQTLFGRQTTFDCNGISISLTDGKLTDTHGRLAGAHLAMDEAVRNIIKMASVSRSTAFKMSSRNPAIVLGLDNELGSIRPGFRAGLTLLDTNLRVVGVLSDGLYFTPN